MKVRTNFIYQTGIILIISLTFLLPGFLQYFIGISSTLYTLLLTAIIFVFVSFHIGRTQKLFYDKILTTCLIYLLAIIVSAIINETAIVKVILYSFFSIIPFVITYFFNILISQEVKIRITVNSLLKVIILIQLPLVLLQKYFYDFLIKFNNSSQTIAEFDFMFGSFPIKADHALGFFLISYLLRIIFNLREKKIKKIPWFEIIYISLTILIIESNLTKIVLALLFSYYILIWLYRKISVFGLIICGLIFYWGLNFVIAKSEVISNEIHHYKYLLSPSESSKAVERGYAKRPQILVHQICNDKISFFGKGPYDYFDILTGKFKNTIHFSQIVWSFNDLGLVGLFIVVLLMYFIIKSLGLDRESKFLLFVIMLLYLFMTNVYFETAILLSLSFINNHLEQKNKC